MINYADISINELRKIAAARLDKIHNPDFMLCLGGCGIMVKRHIRICDKCDARNNRISRDQFDESVSDNKMVRYYKRKCRGNNK